MSVPTGDRPTAAWNPAARERPLAPPPGPASVTWRAFGDLTFVLGAGRRLLIDVGHPVVAAGVDAYSVFETDPYGRADRTLRLIMGVVYGRDDALATARRLRERHVGMRGVDDAGRAWNALDPDAYHWVHASLVDGVWTQQRLLGRGWRPGEVERFYDEMREVGRIYGVRDRDMPADWTAFRRWFDERCADAVVRSDVSDRVLRIIASPPAPPAPVPGIGPIWAATVAPVGGRANALFTAGLLTPVLRERFGIRWGDARQRAFDRHAALLRRTIPRLPTPLRMLPSSHRPRPRA
ncbi:MAG: DUF2236 domain-containing protein [Solirubrobacteraceae bacterium]|nr:DUF2236 domain-containing protein [Solirubrobacteraceae bacterium]